MRATVAAKGWAYYSVNVFWAKIATFLVVGRSRSSQPWRSSAGEAHPKQDAAFAPTADAIRYVRRYLWAEAVLFLLLPIFAAAMARGYGELTQ